MAFQAGEGNGAAAPRRIPLIGIVRIQKIFKTYNYAKDLEKQIKGEFERDEKEIKDLKEKIKAKVKDLDGALTVRGSTQWKLKKNEIDRSMILLEDKERKFRKETAKRMAEFYKFIYDRFRVAVGKYAKYHSYDLIMTMPEPDLSPDAKDAKASNPQAIQNEILLRRVQYVGATTDVTKPVIELMNKLYEREKTKASAID